MAEVAEKQRVERALRRASDEPLPRGVYYFEHLAAAAVAELRSEPPRQWNKLHVAETIARAIPEPEIAPELLLDAADAVIALFTQPLPKARVSSSTVQDYAERSDAS